MVNLKESTKKGFVSNKGIRLIDDNLEVTTIAYSIEMAGNSVAVPKHPYGYKTVTFEATQHYGMNLYNISDKRTNLESPLHGRTLFVGGLGVLLSNTIDTRTRRQYHKEIVRIINRLVSLGVLVRTGVPYDYDELIMYMNKGIGQPQVERFNRLVVKDSNFRYLQVVVPDMLLEDERSNMEVVLFKEAGVLVHSEWFFLNTNGFSIKGYKPKYQVGGITRPVFLLEVYYRFNKVYKVRLRNILEYAEDYKIRGTVDSKQIRESRGNFNNVCIYQPVLSEKVLNNILKDEDSEKAYLGRLAEKFEKDYKDYHYRLNQGEYFILPVVY